MEGQGFHESGDENLVEAAVHFLSVVSSAKGEKQGNWCYPTSTPEGLFGNMVSHLEDETRTK